jgi:hypothetical protein
MKIHNTKNILNGVQNIQINKKVKNNNVQTISQ